MSEFWILEGHEAVPISDVLAWGRMFEDPEARRVAKDEVGEASISTVFLGIDHAFGLGPPLLFETMVFGGGHDQATWRYTTWEEARAGHDRVRASLAAGIDPFDVPIDVDEERQQPPPA